MLLAFLNRLIHRLGREGYEIDNNIGLYNLFLVLFEKFIQLIRGFFLKLFLNKSKGIIFRGKRCRIKHKNLIVVGKTFFIGDYVEINALSRKGVHIGNNVSIHRGTIIDCVGGIRSIGEGLTIGDDVGFSPNCYIQVRGNVIIKDHVIFGPGVQIFSENHNFSDPNIAVNEQGETRKGVTIEEGVWVGSRAIILDGVTVGQNSIIAAGSVVNKSIPAYSIVAGVPARVIKSRLENTNSK